MLKVFVFEACVYALLRYYYSLFKAFITSGALLRTGNMPKCPTTANDLELCERMQLFLDTL